MFFPVPSPIDRPKVSSATLALKPVGVTTQPKVPLSPTFDNIIQEQRRNRRNKISASVDLSFISLPGDQEGDKQPPPAPHEQPQKVVYSTSNYPPKPNAPPCPWKWPEIKAVEGVRLEGTPPGSPASAVSSPASTVSGASTISGAGSYRKDSEELIFKHTPSDPRKRDIVKEERATATRGSPGVRRREVKAHQEESGFKVGRMKPKKRGFVDVGGFDDEDYIHLGLSHDTDPARRYSTDAVNLGRIETYEEKDQARIDRELNRKNRTASMDLSYISVPHLQYGPAPTLLKTSNSVLPTTPSSSTAPSSSNKGGKIIPEVIMHCEPPTPASFPSPLTSRRKRSSDVGIRIIKSPKPQRKVPQPSCPPTATSSDYYLNPDTTPPAERRRSTAFIECSSPISPPERKISVTSLESSSSHIPTRPPSEEEARRGSCTSFLSLNPINPPSQFASLSSQSSTVVYSTASAVSVDKNSAKSPQVVRRILRTTTPTEPRTPLDRDTNSIGSTDRSFPDRAAAVYSSSSNYTDDLPERPSSVVSTLTIPPLSPVPDSSYSKDSVSTHKRNISQTTLFLDQALMNKEMEGQLNSTLDNYPTAERSSSRFSVDLSFANKEQQKGEEEEKDKVEVSPRKLQEDWEIESQSSQAEKSEWTLSEILGVAEEDLHGIPSNEVRPASVTETVSASTQRNLLTNEPGTYKVCKAKIDLIPYRVLTPDVAQQQQEQQPQASAMHSTENHPADNIPDNDFRETTAKLEALTLETGKDRRKFTTEFFFGDAGSSGNRKPLSKSQEPTLKLMDNTKDQLHLDLKNPYPYKLPLSLSEAPCAAALSRFGQYKSEEDLVSPRSHSPRDPLGAKAMPREVPDLLEFKQSVKENLSSLKVSIPKDFPEKRRLIKAHSTESVCSEGEASSSVKGHEQGVTDRGSTEDLIQFSPGGGNSSTISNNKVDTWSAHGAHKEEHSQGSECNHCLYQGDCKSPTCRNVLGYMESFPKKDLPFPHQPLTPQKSDPVDNHQACGHSGEQETEEPTKPGAAMRGTEVRSSLDELCYSKDVFNERQKLMSGVYGDHDPSTTSPTDTTARPLRRKVRPKSAKN